MPAPPLLPVLALDTATETIAAGLHAGGAAFAPGAPGDGVFTLSAPGGETFTLSAPGGEAFTLSAPGGARASTQLLPLLSSLLARAGLQWRDLRAIAYGQGPGAFTGLRTACAVAQGLGYGIGCRLLPLDSLLIVAEDAREQAAAPAGCEVAVAVDARMDEAYAARYRWLGGRWQVLQAPALYTLPALNAAWSGASAQGLVAGSALAAFGNRLSLPARWQRVEREQNRAAALLRLAHRAALDGSGVEPADALPLYLRDKVALTTAERAVIKALATAVPGGSLR